MNYRRVYNRLMMKAWRRVEVVGYFEKHHVIPRCLGGGNSKDNLVILTAAEHYTAHLLLMKMHPERRNMALPIILMSKNIGIGKRNKLVAAAREAAAQSHRGQKRSEETRKRISEAALKSYKLNPERGKDIAERNRQILVTDEFRKKMSNITKGRPGPMTGKTHSEEAKNKISRSLYGNQFAVGMKHSEENKAKFSEQRKGNKFAVGCNPSEETRRRISEKSKMYWANLSEEDMSKFRESKKGNKNVLGLKHTDSTKRVISERSKQSWVKRKAKKEKIVCSGLDIWAAM